MSVTPIVFILSLVRLKRGAVLVTSFRTRSETTSNSCRFLPAVSAASYASPLSGTDTPNAGMHPNTSAKTITTAFFNDFFDSIIPFICSLFLERVTNISRNQTGTMPDDSSKTAGLRTCLNFGTPSRP